MTRVGTGQSSPPLYRIHKNGKYHGGGGGETVANGIPNTAGKSWGVTRGYLCLYLRLGETDPWGFRGGQAGLKGAPPSTVTRSDQGSGWRD